jgi:hypothetical protein
VSTNGVSHSSFTDEPFIGATTEQQSTQASAALSIIGAYTVAFFDRELKHDNGTVLDDKKHNEGGVTVDRYGGLN